MVLSGIRSKAEFLRYLLRTKPRTFYRIDHLFHGRFAGIVGDDGLFCPQAYLCVVYPIQPFQGQLHDARSGASRHPGNPQGDALEVFTSSLRIRHTRLI